MVYDVRYQDVSKTVGKISKWFDSKEELASWAHENDLHVISARPNWKKTLLFFVRKAISPSKGYGELDDKELIQLLKLLRNMKKYRKDERKLRLIFNNYAEGDKRYRNLRAVLKKIIQAMDRGIPLYRILNMTGVPKFVVKAVKVGEKTAQDVKVYDKLIEAAELRYDVSRSISKLLTYPKIVFFVLYLYFLMIVMYQVPKTKEIMSMLDPSKFPDITKKLYAISDYAVNHKVFFVLSTIFGAIAIYKLGYFLVGKISKYLPYIKNVYLARDYTLLAALLSVTTAASIRLSEAIALSADAISVKEIRKKLLSVARDISEKGKSFSSALADHGFDKADYFARDFYNTVFAMEDTGELYEGMEDLYKDYGKAMEDVLDSAKTFIQPLMLFVVVVFVVILFYAVNAPLQTMSGLGGGAG